MQTLLLVEDDPNLRMLYTQELTGEGYRILPAANSEEALSLLQADVPQLAVLDLIMPGMDGIELLGRFVERSPRLPVVINTAYPEYRQNYLTWSADAYIVKSSDLTELKTTIRNILQNPSHQMTAE